MFLLSAATLGIILRVVSRRSWTLISSTSSTAALFIKVADHGGKGLLPPKAYYQRQDLTSVELEHGYKEVGMDAFRESSIQSIILPTTLTKIVQGGFYKCHNLKEVTLPEGLVTVEARGLGTCNNLQKLHISSTVKSLTGTSFGGGSGSVEVTIASGNPYYTYSNGMIIKNKNEVVTCFDNFTEVTTANSITTIGGSAFLNMNNLVKATILGVKKVADLGFYNCPSLKEIVFGANFKDMVTNSFYNCNISSFSIDANNTNYKEYNGVLLKKDSTEVILYPPAKPDTVFTFPKEVTVIKNSVFHMSFVAEFKLASDYTAGKFVAYNGCIYLSGYQELVAVPPELSNVELHESMTRIGDYAMYGYDSGYITIPDRVYFIGKQALRYSKRITMGSSSNSCLTTTDDVSFGNTGITSFEAPKGLECITKACFQWCTSLTTVVLHEGVTLILESAFTNCDKLKSINFPSKLTSIGTNAFNACSELYSGVEEGLILPEGMTYLGNYAFASCKGLTQVTIPFSLPQIGDYAFSSCGYMTYAKLQNCNTKRGINDFFGCSQVLDVVCEATLHFTHPVLVATPRHGTLFMSLMGGTLITHIDGL